MKRLSELASAKDWADLRLRVEAGEGARSDWQLLSQVVYEELYGLKPSLAKLLIARQIGTEWPDTNGPFKPALHMAATAGDIELTKGLIDAGVPLQQRGSGLLALQCATRSRTQSAPTVMRALRSAGGLPNENDFADRSWFATFEGAGPNLPIIAELLDSPNITSAHGLTLLHFAVASHEVESTKALVAAGADVSAKTSEKSVVSGVKVRSGATPLTLAVQMRKKSAAQYSAEMEKALSGGKVRKRRKKAATLIPVFKVPDWDTSHPGHFHPGARLLLHPDRQGLFCAYCGARDLGSEPSPVCEVTAEQIDTRIFAVLSPATFWDQTEGLRQPAARTLDARTAKFAKRVANLTPGSTWRTSSLHKTSGLESATESDRRNDCYPTDKRDVVAAAFREMLDCTTEGGDELDVSQRSLRV